MIASGRMPAFVNERCSVPAVGPMFAAAPVSISAMRPFARITNSLNDASIGEGASCTGVAPIARPCAISSESVPSETTVTSALPIWVR